MIQVQNELRHVVRSEKKIRIEGAVQCCDWPYSHFNGRYIVSGRVPLDPSYTADAALPPQWISIDTEHTYRFGKGRARAGFWELTFVYAAAFNRASAVNFQHGPKDSQDGEQSYRNGPMAARANSLEAGNGSFLSR